MTEADAPRGLQIGGLKSTFVTAWMHGVIIYVVTCIFMFVGERALCAVHC